MHDQLPRLEAGYYQGHACVHWTMAMRNRETGWLKPCFYYKFRELLAHTMFRYCVTCPVYCCMPDHIHLLWIGLSEDSDQQLAVAFFRKHVNAALEKLGTRFQRQPYDHVLREEECERGAFEAVAEYIARNPERKGLVSIDGFREYKYTGCLIPGYPELSPWLDDYWDRFWRVCSYQRQHGLIRGHQH